MNGWIAGLVLVLILLALVFIFWPSEHHLNG